MRACRPRQWSKNLLVVAAPLAAGVIDRPEIALRVAGAFVALCLLSSSTYLVNDVRDRDQDRRHPFKRTRPVAAGELSSRTALRAASIVALLGMGLATAIAPTLGLIGAAYLALTLSYSLLWRRVVVADILAIAAGFVLRALAGGVATDTYLSRWFVIVTASAAIFLVTAKRYSELGEHVGSEMSRATLRRYSGAALRLTLAAAIAIAAIAYISWAFTRASHLVWYVPSIVPFLLWFARYATLVGKGAGQAPEELILRDRTLLGITVAGALLFLTGVYIGR
jgi:decaprenyl-phosphate phosphoribosyltransferase